MGFLIVCLEIEERLLNSIGLERAAPKDVADHRLKRFGRQIHYVFLETPEQNLGTPKCRSRVSPWGARFRFIR
jgi:hypothetical protein